MSVLPENCEIEFKRIGSPTEFWGTLGDVQWDFWAKYGGWEFRLSESPEILPEGMTPADPGHFRNGEFGDPTDQFRQMSEEEALSIIAQCFNDYLSD